MLYYVVVSPLEEHYEKCESVIMKNKEKYHLIIKEYGKNGIHQHLNIIVECATDRVDNVSRKFKLLLKHIDISCSTKYCVRAKRITNIETLVGSYLQKEDMFEVKANTKGYNLEELKKKYDIGKKIPVAWKWKQVPSLLDYIPMTAQFCIDRNLSMPKTYEELMHVMTMQTRERIAVIHLLRKRDEILEILNMLQ